MTARIAFPCILALIVFLLDDPHASAAPNDFRIVALRGQQPPGVSDGREFIAFYNPILNNFGQAAFLSALGTVVGGYDGTFGVWSEAEDKLGLNVVYPAPLPGAGFGSPFFFVFNDQGTTAVSSETEIWLGTSGNFQLVALSGGLAPSGFENTRFTRFNIPVLNRQGTLAFPAGFDGGGFPNFGYQGIWTVSSGSLQLAVITKESILGGFQHPSENLGKTPFFEIFVPPYRPGLTAAGDIVFNAYTVLTSQPGDNGMWTNANGEFQLLMPAQGFPAPGLPNGVRLGQVRRFVSNDSGQFVFSTLLTGDGVDSTNSRSLWAFHDRQPKMIAREGDQAAELPPGIRYRTLFQYPTTLGPQDSLPSLNDAGQIAFVARLTGPAIDAFNDTGIWRTDAADDHLQLIARTGQPAPDTPPGYSFLRLEAPQLNGAGRIAFRADIATPLTRDYLDSGIWAEDAFGALRLIARTGDTIDVDPGPAEDFRTIRELYFTAASEGGCCGYAQPGSAASFNERGQIAFRVVFTDSAEAILVSNLVAVPEPATAALASLFLIATLPVRPSARNTRLENLLPRRGGSP